LLVTYIGTSKHIQHASNDVVSQAQGGGLEGKCTGKDAKELSQDSPHENRVFHRYDHPSEGAKGVSNAAGGHFRRCRDWANYPSLIATEFTVVSLLIYNALFVSFEDIRKLTVEEPNFDSRLVTSGGSI
jgi:hypothetical protein